MMRGKLFLGAVFCVTAFLAPARAQTLSDRVPADAIAFVGWRGSSSMGSAYAQSNLKAVLDQSNLPQVFDEFVPKLIQKFGKDDPQVATVGQLLSAIGGPMWRHPSALYIGSSEIAADKPPTPHVALLCQAGSDSKALLKTLQDQVKNIPNAPFPIVAAMDGDLVVLSVGYAEGELKLPAAGGTKSLATNDHFVHAVAQVGKDPAAIAYLDAEALLALIDKALETFAQAPEQDKWKKARDTLGLAGLKQAAWASGPDEKNWSSNMYVAAPAPRKGLLTALDAKPLSDALLSSIPQGVTLAAAGHLDLAALLSQIHDGAGQLDPAIVSDLDQGISAVSQAIGMDLRKDFLPVFGTEWAYFVDPTIGGSSTAGLVVINRLNDPAKTEATLQKFGENLQKTFAKEVGDKEKMSVGFRVVKIGTISVHYLAVPIVSPAWTIQNGTLYLGLYPQIVAAAARHVPGKGKSILDNEAFAALRTHLGGQKASSIEFLDLPKTAPNAYAGWLMISSLTGFGDVFGVPSPPMVLPQLDQLTAHLSAAGGFAWSDADGFHYRSSSPFPGSSALATDPASAGVGQEAVLVSILLPALNRAREQANRVKSASNLRQIGLAGLQYADQHKGKLPDTLAEMIKSDDLPAQVFINPRSATVVPPGLTKDQAAQWVNEHSDYVWLGKGLTNAASSDTVIAHEKLDQMRDGVNLLYGDGHVEFRVLPSAREQIDASRKAALPKGGAL